MDINFDFGDLKAFLAVFELRSFQRAADQLNLSQSALSRRIQKLESALNVTLFERTTRSMKPTLAAKNFYDRAQTMVDEALEAICAVGEESNRFDSQKNAIITIAAIPTATHNILPNAIKHFRSRGHSARIRILDHFASDVADAVSQGEADMGISFLAAHEPRLEFRAMAEEIFVLAMHPTNPMCERSSIRWSQIGDLPIIAPWKGTGNRMLIDNALARCKARLNWAFEVRHSSTILGLIENQIGVAALPASAIPVRKNPLVVSRPLIEPEITRITGIVRRTGHSLSQAAEQFYDSLVNEYSDRDGFDEHLQD